MPVSSKITDDNMTENCPFSFFYRLYNMILFIRVSEKLCIILKLKKWNFLFFIAPLERAALYFSAAVKEFLQQNETVDIRK